MAETDITKRLMWSGLMAGVTALASIVGSRLAGVIWRRTFGEEPPE